VPREAVKSWTPYPGGAPANVATALERLGVHTAFVSNLGTDERGEQLMALFKGEGWRERCLCVCAVVGVMCVRPCAAALPNRYFFCSSPATTSQRPSTTNNNKKNKSAASTRAACSAAAGRRATCT
jgi:hypothetical protein